MHPFENIPAEKRPAVFWPVLLLSLTLTVALTLIGKPLKNETAPGGIITFEFARDAADASRIVASWDASARQHAALSLGLDYLYLFAYSTAIGFACAWLAASLRGRGLPLLAKAGIWLAWAQWLAALFDALENYVLLRALFSWISDAMMQFSRGCTLLKFVIVAAGLLYLLVGQLAKLFARTT